MYWTIQNYTTHEIKEYYGEHESLPTIEHWQDIAVSGQVKKRNLNPSSFIHLIRKDRGGGEHQTYTS